MNFTVNLSALPPEVAHRVIHDLQHEDKARYDLGRIEQLQMKRLHDAVPQLGHGLGSELRQSMMLSRDQWVRFMQKYGQRCWSDPDFTKWVGKQEQHQDLVVRDRPTKIQSGYTGHG